MLFVVAKQQFQRTISIVRDDRIMRSTGRNEPFLRLEARDDYLKLVGLEVAAQIPATVYEPGVLFLKVSLVRRLLGTIKSQEFITIQVMADGFLMNNIRFPLEENDMLLYADPAQAPEKHPSVALEPPPATKRKSDSMQLMLWDPAETNPNPEDSETES